MQAWLKVKNKLLFQKASSEQQLILDLQTQKFTLKNRKEQEKRN